MDDFEKRVRDRAYKLWQQEGRPEGRAKVHWEKARGLVAIEENIDLTLKPIPRPDQLGPYGEPWKPLALRKKYRRDSHHGGSGRGRDDSSPAHRPIHHEKEQK
jgi:hypothetical protein